VFKKERTNTNKALTDRDEVYNEVSGLGGFAEVLHRRQRKGQERIILALDIITIGCPDDNDANPPVEKTSEMFSFIYNPVTYNFIWLTRLSGFLRILRTRMRASFSWSE